MKHVHPGHTNSLLMPHLVLQDEWSFVWLSEVLCTVNTQHNCSKYQCSTTGIRHVYQERVRTTATKPVVEHVSSPDDLVLNMAQMRNAVYLQQFRISPIPLDLSKTIQESAACAIDQRRLAKTGATRGCGCGRSRGRGIVGERAGCAGNRGRGRGRGRGGETNVHFISN